MYSEIHYALMHHRYIRSCFWSIQGLYRFISTYVLSELGQRYTVGMSAFCEWLGGFKFYMETSKLQTHKLSYTCVCMYVLIVN